MIKQLKINWNGDTNKDTEIYQYLTDLKTQKGSELSIIDIGGAAELRLPQITTHVLDFQPYKLKDKSLQVFSGDMELNSTWDPIFDYIDKNGKFDFVVCTHTLEDLNSPHQVMLNLFKIANAGLIAVPTKYIETRKWERHYGGGGYLGYHHHRWIYTVKNGILMCYPKQGTLEYVNFNFSSSDNYNRIYGDKQTEMSLLWENGFETDFTYPHQYLDHFEDPNRKSKIDYFMENDDIDDYFNL